MTRLRSPDLCCRHPGGETEIFVGADALGRAGGSLSAWSEGRGTFLITSEAVAERQPELLEQLEERLGAPTRLAVPDGEAAKSLATAERLWRAMLDAGGTRDSRLVALGGGSVTDVGGFVASCFLRGIASALVPTTLLAQVDAALGGKTGVDLPGAKNSVGSFWHPAYVVAPTSSLGSLDSRQWRSGLVEVIKISLSEDLELFERLEASAPELLSPPTASGQVDRWVERAMRAKIAVVESDPAEGDRRRVLNLGHTLGHAIESVLGYETLLHGEAVAYGLLFVLRLGRRRGLDAGFADRVRELLARLDPPPLPRLDPQALLAAMGRDKKARREGLYWVVPVAPGRLEITRDVGAGELETELDAFLADPLGR